jgi:hypothetical protein
MKSIPTVAKYSIAIILSLCCICGVCAIATFSFSPPTRSSPVIQIDTPIPIETIIALTYSAAGAQTAIFNPTSLPTATLAPTIEIESTATTFISVIQTNAAANPTEYIFVTITPFSLATQPSQSTLQPTVPQRPANCSCSGDMLNCPDFNSHSEAQTCFDYCKSLGFDDPNKLDRNNNNIACEDTNY